MTLSKWAIGSVVLAAAAAAQAVTTSFFDVEFDLSAADTGSQFDETATPGSATFDVQEQKGVGEELDGIDLELTISSTTAGKINRTTTSLGIDATGSGDDTDALDAAENISFLFNMPVEISTLDFDNFDDLESINYVAGVNNGTITFAALADNVLDVYTFVSPLYLTAGQAITFSGLVNGDADADGIGFDDFTLRVVPEPAAIALLAFAGLMLRRRSALP